MLGDPSGKFVGPFGQTREIEQNRLARNDMKCLRNLAQEDVARMDLSRVWLVV
jgi:hypothetical protein